MSHFAKVIDGVVIDVIVAEQEFFDTFIDDTPGEWIQTSYNDNIRGRFASIGGIYDSENDVFTDKQPHPSWVLENNIWKAPVDRPDETSLYNWDEDTTSWVETVEE